MADQPGHKAAWVRWLTGTALTTFAVAVVWGARAYGRSIVFAFGVNCTQMGSSLGSLMHRSHEGLREPGVASVDRSSRRRSVTARLGLYEVTCTRSEVH